MALRPAICCATAGLTDLGYLLPMATLITIRSVDVGCVLEGGKASVAAIAASHGVTPR